LHAELDIPPEEAFQLLSRVSQNANRKVREMCADIVGGRIDPENDGDLVAAPGLT